MIVDGGRSARFHGSERAVAARVRGIQMMRLTAIAALCAAPLALFTGPAWAKDDLIIGVAQFPSSLHPDVDAEVVKAYVNDFVIRPITAYDPNWKNSCLLCTELP